MVLGSSSHLTNSLESHDRQVTELGNLRLICKTLSYKNLINPIYLFTHSFIHSLVVMMLKLSKGACS